MTPIGWGTTDMATKSTFMGNGKGANMAAVVKAASGGPKEKAASNAEALKARNAVMAAQKASKV